MEWWEELYGAGDAYQRIFFPYLDDDSTYAQVNFIVRQLNILPSHRILDLCCGTGRHSLELSRRNFNVVGLDWNGLYLSQARDSAQRQRLSVEFIQKDMRNIDEYESFDIVLNMFTSFGYFKTDEENEAVLKGIAKALKPNGLFFFDFINLAALLRFPIPVIWHHNPLTQEVIIRERHIDLFSWRLEEKCKIFNPQGFEEYRVSYRLYTLAEFINMLSRNGLHFENAFGNYDGSDYCENFPPRMIVISRKKS